MLAGMVASTLLVTGELPPAAAEIPLSLSAEDLACQQATFTAATSYVQKVFAARHDCLFGVMRGDLAASVDCFAGLDAGTGDELTDSKLDTATQSLAVDLARRCIGLDFTALGFPGFCPILVEAEYDSFDHESCVLAASDKVVEKLLSIEHPWPIAVPLAMADRNCADTIGRKSSRMFVNEVEARNLCQQRQLEGEIALAVECRGEADRFEPATGDGGLDTDIVSAHNKVLREIANACTRVDLSVIGFPFSCEVPSGSTFGTADLVECMFQTHHAEMIRYMDVLSPSTTLCGNGELDFTEDCDDGDNDWALGQVCRANCSEISKCGDVNGDDKITAVDASFVLQVAISLQTCDPRICDVNNDGRVTATDALMLLQLAVGLDVTLTCPGFIDCGNGVVDEGESCDDGDTEWSLGEFCNATCRTLLCGDPNDSGTITVQDAQYMLLVAISLATCDLEVCDVDSSGVITTVDVQRVLAVAIGQDVPLICPG